MSRISVVIPTLNEAERITATLHSVRQALPDAEIVVADGGSSDATQSLAAQLANRVIATERGRGVQLDEGFRASTGDVCLFLHADTVLPHNAAAAIQRTLANPAVAGGAFRLRFERSRALPWTLALHERAINLGSRWRNSATGDQAMFARRSALAAVGGVSRVPLFEDVRLWKALRQVGELRLLPEAVTTSPRLWSELGSARGILLHLLLRALYAAGVSPQRLSRLYPTVR